jgi:hypothetical protein
MNKIKLLTGDCISVSEFDDRTHKKPPYYQNNGSRYASCPNCGSVVSIKGGHENKNQSNQKRMYASHLAHAVNGFELNDYRHCEFYQGNEGNWQGVYQVNAGIAENEELRTYIQENQVVIARELLELTGILFENRSGVNNLFNDIHQSFKKNMGLYRKRWHPDAVPRIMLERAAPVRFWGYIVNDKKIARRISENQVIGAGLNLKSNQFKGANVSFVAAVDNNENPQRIRIKLVWGNEELVLKSVSAKIT